MEGLLEGPGLFMEAPGGSSSSLQSFTPLGALLGAQSEAANGAAAAGDAGEGAVGSSLGSLSLPAAVLKRIARSAVPGVRLSSEALAALHRIAQVYVCFATDRGLGQVKAEGEKKKKGKSNPVLRKTLHTEHVMRFLSAEMPPLASKLASLCPELMPVEFKPAGVQLLEALHEQERKVQKAGERVEGGEAVASDEAAAASNPQSGDLSGFFGGKRPAESAATGAGKRARHAPSTSDEPTAAPVPLTRFFGASRPAAAAAPLEEGS
ncbi:unnamed protein product [Polarella glacialis]|uniref:Uncharacterized protein n=1 Tax=Polarella glacialis TaxID=89957 RepID=A0A813DXQ7_POLGL|nr:unnamed protein product [Polarella glacialis]|mmetsp:Transcript_103577/g.186877  ORF Transcript_103577/g.186877 Transcript_103577/m.186877 type:complete len:265 (-) Transcript_103577:64-858(-)